MHVRLPKPLHGWRAFAGEVGIVVLGVLIALGAGQVVQTIHDRQAAAHASVSIKWELARQRLDALERLAVQPCLTGQLNRLSARLAAFRGGEWAAMPMNVAQASVNSSQWSTVQAYRAPERLWVSEAWQTARSNGSLNYLPDATVSADAELYNRGERIRLLQAQESDAAAELAPLALDGPIDVATRASLLGEIAKVDHANAVMVYEARALIVELDPLLRDLPRQEIDRQVAQMLAVERKLRGSCVLDLKLPDEERRS